MKLKELTLHVRPIGQRDGAVKVPQRALGYKPTELSAGA